MSASVDDCRCVALGQTTNDWLVSRASDRRRPHVFTWSRASAEGRRPRVVTRSRASSEGRLPHVVTRSRASAEGRRPHVVFGGGTLETTVEALHIVWSVPATGRRAAAAAGDVGSFDIRSLGGSWFMQSDTG